MLWFLRNSFTHQSFSSIAGYVFLDFTSLPGNNCFTFFLHLRTDHIFRTPESKEKNLHLDDKQQIFVVQKNADKLLCVV